MIYLCTKCTPVGLQAQCQQRGGFDAAVEHCLATHLWVHHAIKQTAITHSTGVLAPSNTTTFSDPLNRCSGERLVRCTVLWLSRERHKSVADTPEPKQNSRATWLEHSTLLVRSLVTVIDPAVASEERSRRWATPRRNETAFIVQTWCSRLSESALYYSFGLLTDSLAMYLLAARWVAPSANALHNMPIDCAANSGGRSLQKQRDSFKAAMLFDLYAYTCVRACIRTSTRFLDSWLW